MKIYDNDAVERLVTAIISNAVNEYRGVFRRKLYGKKLKPWQQKMFDDAEEFFYSPDFERMTNMDGEYFMERIVQEERAKRLKEISRTNKKKTTNPNVSRTA